MRRLGLTILAADRPGLLRDLAAAITEHGANIEAIHHASGPVAEMHIDLSGVSEIEPLLADARTVAGVTSVEALESTGDIWGKRVIVIGGGAQVAQVVLGAVSEADRHNIRGERISVDTMPIVGEQRLAEAVRGVARLPRVRILVLAGSIMGGEVTHAVRELRSEHGIPVISLNMVGSVVQAVDLVVSDPVQAGVMAVMAIADTASFNIHRLQSNRL